MTHLWSKWRDEKIEPEHVLTLTDQTDQYERLGIFKAGDISALRTACRQYIPPRTCARTSSISSRFSNTNILTGGRSRAVKPVMRMASNGKLRKTEFKITVQIVPDPLMV